MVVVLLLLWSWQRPSMPASIHTDRQADSTGVPLHTCYIHLIKYEYLHSYITVHYSIITAQCLHTYLQHPHMHALLHSTNFTFCDPKLSSGVPGRFSWTTCGLPCIECLETDGKKRLLQPMSLWRGWTHFEEHVFFRWVEMKPPTRLELLVSLGRYSYLLSCFFVFVDAWKTWDLMERLKIFEVLYKSQVEMMSKSLNKTVKKRLKWLMLGVSPTH